MSNLNIATISQSIAGTSTNTIITPYTLSQTFRMPPPIGNTTPNSAHFTATTTTMLNCCNANITEKLSIRGIDLEKTIMSLQKRITELERYETIRLLNDIFVEDVTETILKYL
jgi:hypothetical protein